MKASILLANYNHAGVIHMALASIEKQTYTDWEVVIVDDASTDNSVEVIQSFVASSYYSDRYKLLTLSDNKGVGHAKRYAAAHASGEILAICDPDDALHPNAITKVMHLHQMRPDVSLAFTNLYYCDSDLVPQKTREDVTPIQHSDLKENQVSHLVAFKSSAYSQTAGFDAEFRLAEDKDLYYKLEEVGDIAFLNEPLYYYRVWPKSISQGFDSLILSRDYGLKAIQNAVARRAKSGIKQLSNKELHALIAEVHLLKSESILYSRQKLGLAFWKHLGMAAWYNPLSNLTRKLKALLLITRIKRSLVGIFSR